MPSRAQLAVERGAVARLLAERMRSRRSSTRSREERAGARRACGERDALSAERDKLALQLSAAKSEVDFVSGRLLEANEQIARAEATIAHIGSRYAEKYDASKKGLFRSSWKRSRRLRSSSVNGKDLEAIHNSVFFDERYYLETNPDVRETGIDAARHYLAFGGREGRDPGPFFSTETYLARHPDVAEAGLNPLLHYEAHGRRENRGLLPLLSRERELSLGRRVDYNIQSTAIERCCQFAVDALPIPWPPRDPSNAAHVGLRRFCIFSFYDPQGIVDDYVVFFLRKLGEFAETIIFYSNGPLSRDSEIKLRGVVDDVVLRPNVGFDVWPTRKGSSASSTIERASTTRSSW